MRIRAVKVRRPGASSLRRAGIGHPSGCSAERILGMINALYERDLLLGRRAWTRSTCSSASVPPSR